MGKRARWLIASLALAGCGTAPVEWELPVSVPSDTTGRVALDGATPSFPSIMPTTSLPPDSARCTGSEATASDSGRLYATWLRRRANGSVLVLAARSDNNGVSWTSPGIVDSVDVGRSGCSHPSPSIAASGGYVHIAYSLDAPEGFGVFFAHSMDRAATFHSPLPVIYGDRLAAAAVAADDMHVIVAYEDPSGNGHRVAVALSNTQGHSFERRVNGSPDDVEAMRPEVAVRGTSVALTFGGLLGGMRTMRLGHIAQGGR